jgi:hypothetical protein
MSECAGRLVIAPQRAATLAIQRSEQRGVKSMTRLRFGMKMLANPVCAYGYLTGQFCVRSNNHDPPETSVTLPPESTVTIRQNPRSSSSGIRSWPHQGDFSAWNSSQPSGRDDPQITMLPDTQELCVPGHEYFRMSRYRIAENYRVV